MAAGDSDPVRGQREAGLGLNPGSKPLVQAPQALWTSLTNHECKNKTIQDFRMVTTEP